MPYKGASYIYVHSYISTLITNSYCGAQWKCKYVSIALSQAALMASYDIVMADHVVLINIYCIIYNDKI